MCENWGYLNSNMKIDIYINVVNCILLCMFDERRV